jgi:RHS repeat-associated protein
MTLPNGISTAYSYDAAGRLTGMKYSKGSTVLRDLVYGYDEINRRTSYSGNTAPEPQETATNTATVDASNRYTSLNGKPVSHDANGNQTINSAVWDARDRLVSLSSPGFTAAFTYDAMGRRTSKTVNGQTKTYLYDGSDLISETGADYTFGPGIDQPLERKSGQNEYYLSDALGSVIGLADGNGSIKTSYNYSPFGKKQTTGTSSSNPFAFTGREDDSTGYYYYRARYYNPDQKRFIAEDPLEFGGGDTNFYTYVGNKPISFIDPSGLNGIGGGPVWTGDGGRLFLGGQIEGKQVYIPGLLNPSGNAAFQGFYSTAFYTNANDPCELRGDFEGAAIEVNGSVIDPRLGNTAFTFIRLTKKTESGKEIYLNLVGVGFGSGSSSVDLGPTLYNATLFGSEVFR